MKDYARKGEEFYQAMYRDKAASVQALLDDVYPDMGSSAFPRIHAYLLKRRIQAGFRRL